MLFVALKNLGDKGVKFGIHEYIFFFANDIGSINMLIIVGSGNSLLGLNMLTILVLLTLLLFGNQFLRFLIFYFLGLKEWLKMGILLIFY
jgi:hypothetical protein